jgi:hypothetical protein
MTSERWRCKAAGVLKRRPCEKDEGDEAGGATPDGSFDGTLGSDPVHQDRPHHGARLIDLRRCGPSSDADCKNDRVYRLLAS